MVTTIITAILSFLIGGIVTWLVTNYLIKSKGKRMIEEAQKEAETIKKDKLLEVKEKFMLLKADFEKQVSIRNSKNQSQEAKLKQRELIINQKQEELYKKKGELDIVRENLENQLDLIEKKKQDLDKIHKLEIERLELISGISAEEAKERLAQSLKEEAQTSAAAYINEVMEEAKMTANKE
ncbi:MAG: Rnase Y domain-containing protein, partial [Bacteroidales bacterium]|nr:Rnase Y domain-containing protein [Bacteroidales bacterium]